MPLYTYNSPDSLLRSVSAISTLSGTHRAYLEMKPDAKPEDYTHVIGVLEGLHLQAIPAEYQGRPALEVLGYRNDGRFLDKLKQFGLIQGDPVRQDLPDDKHSRRDLLAARTLNMAGWSYVLGDLAIGWHAFMEDSFGDKLAALGYTLGTQALLWYGKDQTPTRLKDMTRDMLAHLHTNGVDVPPESAIYGIAKEDPKGITHKVDNFLKRFPSEAMGASFGVAGIGMIIASQGYKGDMLPLRTRDTVLGATTLTSGLISMFVKEKPHEPGTPHKEGLGRIWEWVQEKPLRVAGYGLMASTAIHGWSTAESMLKYHETWKQTGLVADREAFFSKSLRGVFVVTNLIAELLISLSSKGHGEGVKGKGGEDQSAYALAADILSHQDPEHKAYAEEQLANFLSHKDVLSEPKETVLAGIRHQLGLMAQNPWAVNAPKHLIPPPAFLTEDGRIDYNQRNVQQRYQTMFPNQLPAQSGAMPGMSMPDSMPPSIPMPMQDTLPAHETSAPPPPDTASPLALLGPHTASVLANARRRTLEPGTPATSHIDREQARPISTGPALPN